MNGNGSTVIAKREQQPAIVVTFVLLRYAIKYVNVIAPSVRLDMDRGEAEVENGPMSHGEVYCWSDNVLVDPFFLV